MLTFLVKIDHTHRKLSGEFFAAERSWRPWPVASAIAADDRIEKGVS
jgi:hypothetical protein